MNNYFVYILFRIQHNPPVFCTLFLLYECRYGAVIKPVTSPTAIARCAANSSPAQGKNPLPLM